MGSYTFTLLEAGPAGGPLVLLVHGSPQTLACSDAVIATLASADFRVAAPAQRGYSPSARPRSIRQHRVDALTADVTALADHLGAKRFSIAGHDWGGLIAWLLASVGGPSGKPVQEPAQRRPVDQVTRHHGGLTVRAVSRRRWHEPEGWQPTGVADGPDR